MHESLSYSRRYLWNKCRKAHHYKYVRKLRPAATALPFERWQQFSRGTLIHGCLESVFLGEPMQAGLDRSLERFEREGLDEERRIALPGMMSSAKIVAKTVADWLPASDWEPLAVEAKLTAPLAGWAGGFVGYADLIARHRPSGFTLVLDWKTRTKFDADNVGAYDLQLAAYQHCAKLAGYEVHGTALVEIKPDPPKRAPRYTRSDTFSFYSVRESPDGRIRFTPTLRSAELVQTLWSDFEREAVSIAKHQADPAEIFRNTSAFNCAGCPYRFACFSEANGEDVDYVEKNEYTVEVAT